MQVFEQQQGNKGCPNLDAQGILACADKGFDLQVLLEGLEEYLDFPPVFVDGGNGARAKVEVIGQENNFSLILLIPDDNAAKQMGAFLFRLGAGKADNLIGEDGTALRNFSFFDNFVDGIFFLPGNKENPICRPVREQGVVVIGTVKGDDRSRFEIESAGNSAVMTFGFRDKGE